MSAETRSVHEKWAIALEFCEETDKALGDKRMSHARAAADAILAAQYKPGCEVRFTCKTKQEALYHGLKMSTLLHDEGLLLDSESTPYNLELLNGSCIRILVGSAKKQKGKS